MPRRERRARRRKARADRESPHRPQRTGRRRERHRGRLHGRCHPHLRRRQQLYHLHPRQPQHGLQPQQRAAHHHSAGAARGSSDLRAAELPAEQNDDQPHRKADRGRRARGKRRLQRKARGRLHRRDRHPHHHVQRHGKRAALHARGGGGRAQQARHALSPHDRRRGRLRPRRRAHPLQPRRERAFGAQRGRVRLRRALRAAVPL